jgi:hypothetical protein
MALTAQQVYNQSLGLQRNRANQMYGRNLEMLAKQMRDASEGLEANLEGRGVLRSGEANTGRQRLQEQGAAQRRYLTEDRDYQLQQINLDEQARRAAQAAGGGGGGGSTSTMPAPVSRTPDQILADLLKASGFKAPAPNGGRPVGQMAVRIQRPTSGTVDTTVRRRLAPGVRLG